MSAVCEICGKEFRTTQGLRGHKTFVHRLTNFSGKSATPLATEQKLDQLTTKVEKVESIIGLKEPSSLDGLLGTDKPITEQVTKLSDTVSKLSEDVELARVSKAMVDADKAHYDNRLEELNQNFREVHNKLVTVVNSNGEQLKKAIDAFNSKFATTDRNFLETNKCLDKVEAQLVKDRDAFKSIERTTNSLKADIDDIRLRMLRKPADSEATLRMKDGRDHRFREYRGPQGLRRPHKTATDWISGDKFVDLSEPED